jgi:hypothetical protein
MFSKIRLSLFRVYRQAWTAFDLGRLQKQPRLCRDSNPKEHMRRGQRRLVTKEVGDHGDRALLSERYLWRGGYGQIRLATC